jgi:hypothetical protein
MTGHLCGSGKSSQSKEIEQAKFIMASLELRAGINRAALSFFRCS